MRRRLPLAALLPLMALLLANCEVVRPSDGAPNATPAPPRPPKVLLVGDSILAQPAPTIVEQLGALGVRTHAAAVSGTGLLTGAIDWQARARRLVEQFRPDVVVALFVGNYPANTPTDPHFDDDGPFPSDQQGAPIAEDTPEFFDAWQGAAKELSSTLAARGARVYWVEPPPMLEWDPLHRADALYAGYRQLGALHETMGYLSPRASVAGPAGEWISKTVACGVHEQLRTADTVHFAKDGARRYGQTLARLLADAQRWGRVPPPCSAVSAART